MSPLFSIITVTYNAESTLPPTIASVDSQTLRDFEHIIVDGASTDRTVAIASQGDPAVTRRRVLSEPDNGIYDAMNKGLDMATGHYVMFLNAGDSLHGPDILSRMARIIAHHTMPGIVYGQTAIVDSERRYVGERHLRAPVTLSLESFADGMVVCHQAFVALRKITSHFNTSYRFSADYEWCIHCLQHSRQNVYIDTTLVDYLEVGTTTANLRASLLERFRIMARYYGIFTAIRRHIGFVPRFFRRRFIEKRAQ